MAEIVDGEIFHAPAHIFDRLRIIGMVSKALTARALLDRPTVQLPASGVAFEGPVDSPLHIHVFVTVNHHGGSIRLWTLQSIYATVEDT